MPDLDTDLHLEMLSHAKQTRRSLPRRLLSAIGRELAAKDLYGLQWGDPDHFDPLRFIKSTFVTPFVDQNHVAVEIGPGGGRWTRYLLPFQRLYLVDYHPELLAELRRSFARPNMTFVANNGTDFPGIAADSVDFVFSFGTFVHLDQHLIAGYLENIHSIIRPGANVVIHYSDKRKIMAQLNDGFSENDPDTMRRMVADAGFRIVHEDTTTMWHSSLVRFTKDRSSN